MTLSSQLKSVLQDKQIVTIDELCTATNRAAITVRQALTQLDYLTSYDNNSRYYALRATCRFNKDGIWKHPKASFTLHKTLTALLVALIQEAPDGLTSGELERITGVVVAGMLRRLAQKGLVVRARAKGQYFYFSAQSKRTRGAQAKARFGSSTLLKQTEGDLPVEELSRTITVLLEIIRSRPTTIRQLREAICRQHAEIPSPKVQEICKRYDIRLRHD
jgi:hypothetical protein